MAATNPFAAELLSASGRSAEKVNLPTLQDKMKRDPESYASELTAIQGLFDSSLELFKQQAALSFSSISGIAPDSTIAKDLGDRTMFLAHMAPFYPKQLSQFPSQLAEFLKASARSLPSGLRLEVTKALILLMNRKMADIRDALALFMELQTLGDKVLRKLAFEHVVHTIRRMNKKSKNQSTNRPLQKVMFETLKQDDEVKAKRALITLRELHRRKVWFDDETSNAICRACLHPSSWVMIAALSFLLDYEKIEDETDSDESSDEDESAHKMPAAISKESVYKANHKGTVSSKKKKKAKLQRAMRSLKKQQRLSSEKTNSNYYSPLNYLIDAQGFAEKLFSRLQTSNERFEVKMMVLKVIARTIGLHRLTLLNFYPYLQKYAQPHQRDVTTLLAAAVQACHDMVPPDAVEPLFRQIVNQFVHDRSRPEAIAVGLNVVREICLRIPSLMTEDLLQDLVLYKKTHEKAVSVAARSLMSLFREICPSMLAKKDRGRPSDPKARPRAYGETSVLENVSGLELLEDDDGADGSEKDMSSDENEDGDSDNEENEALSDDSGSEDNELNEYDTEHASEKDNSSSGEDIGEEDDGDEDASEDSEEEDGGDSDEDEIIMEDDDDAATNGSENNKSKTKKRKFSDFDGQLIAGETSLRALKKLGATLTQVPTDDSTDGILSNEQFKRIKQLKAKEDAKAAMFKHGLLGKGNDAKSHTFKVPDRDQLSLKRVDPAKLQAHVRQKLNKEERLALVKAGRDERGKYVSSAAVKKKKTGGLSNKQKEHKKPMPIAAKRAKIVRGRNQKLKNRQNPDKQFRGKKAWK